MPMLKGSRRKIFMGFLLFVAFSAFFTFFKGPISAINQYCLAKTGEIKIKVPEKEKEESAVPDFIKKGIGLDKKKKKKKKNQQKAMKKLKTKAFFMDAARPSDPKPETMMPGLHYKLFKKKVDSVKKLQNLQPDKTGIMKFPGLNFVNEKAHYGLIWEGYVKIPREAVYYFYLTSDDGSRMFLGNKEIISNDGFHGMVEASAKVKLKQGFHKIRVDFFQTGGGQGLKLEFKSPGIKRRLLNADKLVTDKFN